MSLKLLVMLGLAALPFVAIVLLVLKGPRGSAVKVYREAIQRREAVAEEVDAIRERLALARQRLRASQRELAACAGLDPDVGDPDAPSPPALARLDGPAVDTELDAA